MPQVISVPPCLFALDSAHSRHSLQRGRPLGQAVTPGAEIPAVRAGADGDLEAVTFISGRDAQRIEPGMEARVLRGKLEPDGWERALKAEVHEVSPQPASPPGWLTALGLAAPRVVTW